MAVWDSASIKANTSSPRADAYHVEREVSGKWHLGTRLAFVVISCSLLWAGIFAVIALVF